MVAGPQVILPPDDVEPGQLIDLLIWPERKVNLVLPLLSDGESLPPAGHVGVVTVEETQSRRLDTLLNNGTDTIRGRHPNH